MASQLPPSRLLIADIATRLGELNEQVVFVGGIVTDLLMTRVPSPQPRATKDIDVIVSVATTPEFSRFEESLRARGFSHDKSPGAPICRWIVDGLLLDAMPVESKVLGFVNRWYPEAVKTAMSMPLGDNLVVRIIAPPVFIATKLEAFSNRGEGNYDASDDIDDVISVIDGREEIISEIETSSVEVRQFLIERFSSLLGDNDFTYSISAHLLSDAGSQARHSIIIDRMEQISCL